ncbi:histone [Candidatus Aenigmatarchaeota archaeon]
MSEFTLEPLRKMMKKAGAKRVSDKAASALADKLEEKTITLLTQADKLSKHAGRRTVMRQDIKMARKVIEK